MRPKKTGTMYGSSSSTSFWSMLDELDADALMVIPSSSSNTISANKRPKCEHTGVYRNKISIEMNSILARRLKQRIRNRGLVPVVSIPTWSFPNGITLRSWRRRWTKTNWFRTADDSAAARPSNSRVRATLRMPRFWRTVFQSKWQPPHSVCTILFFFFFFFNTSGFNTTVSSWLKMW